MTSARLVLKFNSNTRREQIQIAFIKVLNNNAGTLKKWAHKTKDLRCCLLFGRLVNFVRFFVSYHRRKTIINTYNKLSRGKQLILFPENLTRDQSLQVICYIAGKFKAGNSKKNLAVTEVVGQHSRVTIHCYPLIT